MRQLVKDLTYRVEIYNMISTLKYCLFRWFYNMIVEKLDIEKKTKRFEIKNQNPERYNS